MLNKTKWRKIMPGQWTRVIVPDYESWHKGDDMFWGWKTRPGDEVDVCVCPIYCPKYDSADRFEWRYRMAYRSKGSPTYASYYNNSGSWLSTFDFGLVDSTSFNRWSKEEFDDLHYGRGGHLYQPASDDPELCPGPDCSVYYCDQCQRYQEPFSNDDGVLGCPYCDTEGLVITDEGTLRQLEQAREFARSIGLLSQLEHQLEWLATYGRHEGAPRRQCILGGDFATYSFSFAHYELPNGEPESKRRFWFNGGLIYQGPRHPADGSFPSLTVSLHCGTGWFCHT
jgi:hypothetical protein